MTSIFINYFLILNVVIALFYVIGSLIFQFGRIHIEWRYTAIFSKMVLSSSLFVLCVSIFYTHGFTVNLFLIPILFSFFYKYWRKASSKSNEERLSKKEIIQLGLVLFIGALAFYMLRFGQIYNPNSNIPLLPHSDIVYYSNCIDFLTHFGRENSSVDYVNGAKSGTSPYHYFELWFGAGISRLFGLNTALSLILVTFSISVFVIWIGFCAVLEHFKVVKLFDIVFCFCLVFLTGIAFQLYTYIPFMKYIFVFSYNTWNYPKLFPIYFFSIAALLFFLKKKDNQGVLCLLILPIVFISTSFGIFLGIFCWIVITYIMKKQTHLNVVFLMILIIVGLYSFYNFFTAQTSTHVDVGISDTIQKMTSLTFLKTTFNVCIGATLQITLIFSPFALAYFVFIKHLTIRIIAFQSALQIIALVYLFSLLGWGILHDKLSTVQVFTNVGISFLTILSSLILIMIWVHQVKLFSVNRLLVLLFLIIGIRNSTQGFRYEYIQSDNFIESVANETKNVSHLGCFILDSKDYADANFSYVANFAILGQYLIYSEMKTFPLSISPYSYHFSSDPKSNKIASDCLRNTPFWIYVEKQKATHKFQSIERSQIDFIKKMKINYLICTKNAHLSSLLQARIKKEIVDNNTGERFILLL